MSRRSATVLAWALCGLSYALVGAFVWLEVLHHRTLGSSEFLFDGSIALVGVFFPGVGAFLASRRGENPICWLMIVIGLSLAASAPAHAYSQWGPLLGTGAPRFGQWVAWLGTWAWVPGFTLIPTLLLLWFPDRRFPSSRWRWVERLAYITVAVMTVGSMFDPNPTGQPDYRNPLGVRAHSPASNLAGLQVLGLLLFVVCATLSVVALVKRFRRSSGEERQQMKWFVYAGVAWLVLLPGNTVLAQGRPWLEAVGLVAVPLLPSAIGIAVLKYGLYDVDVVINKTVVYASLAGFITAVYVGIVVGLGTLIGSSTSKPNLGLSILATAVVAVAFQPVRGWVQKLANRLVYGQRATPYEVLSEFSSRMAGAYASEDLLPRMARILAEGTGARSAVVWLKVGDELRPEAAWPLDELPTETLTVTGEDLPDSAATLALGVHHRGELLGALSLTKPAGERLTPAEEHLARDLASGAGLVLRNVRLTEELLHRLEELKVSRQRIVTAQDQERRRLERNIHDGAQQQLVALALKIRLARQLGAKNPTRANDLLEQTEVEVSQALEDLRDLARGIYPPLLADGGLIPALEGQARRSAVPVHIEADGIARYSQEAEAAVYFCVLEALQNVAKYAGASKATVRLSERGGHLGFEVTDDGAGFDRSRISYGTGLQGMADRLAALGGEFEVRSAPGAGTTVVGRLPVLAMAGTSQLSG